jgi:hypothetical protein
MKRVTVVGSGFAALTAVKTLRARNQDLDITLVSPRAEFHYLPGSIWIPSGLREPSDLIIPLGKFFHRMRVNHHTAEATGLLEHGAYEVVVVVLEVFLLLLHCLTLDFWDSSDEYSGGFSAAVGVNA